MRSYTGSSPYFVQILYGASRMYPVGFLTLVVSMRLLGRERSALNSIHFLSRGASLGWFILLRSGVKSNWISLTASVFSLSSVVS